jgi:hypothetical protein
MQMATLLRLAGIRSDASIIPWGDDVRRALDKYEHVRDELDSTWFRSNYEADVSLKAKSLSLHAWYWRLIGQTTESDIDKHRAVRAAAAYIMEACQIAPDQEDVEKELRLIKAWGEECGLIG